MKRGSVRACIGAMAVILSAAGCLRDGDLASTEILNPPGKSTVQGFIRQENGAPAGSTVVEAFPADYDPVSDSLRPSSRRYRDSTDGDGAFFIPGMEAGIYNLMAVQIGDGKRLMIRDVKVRNLTTVASDDAILRAPGALSVSVPDSLDGKGAYVYIPGTSIHVSVGPGNARRVLLDSVPPGRAPGIFFNAAGRTIAPAVLALEVLTRPGDTVPAGAFASWAHNRRLFLNTTASGAQVTGKVTDFPLLVRLDSGNFDFTQAHADGSDLRFAKKDGTPLAHEIEDWNRLAARASIWVKVDTVHGDYDLQFIRMYWGNVTARAQTSGAAVFSTGAGYQGVWHLNENGGTATGGYKDATANGNHGTGYNLGAWSKTEGLAGHGQQFDGDSTYINAGTGKSLHAETGLTLEAWVKIDTVTFYGNFISKAFTRHDYPLYEYGLSLGGGPGVPKDTNFRFTVTADTSNRDLFSKQKVVNGRWYQIAGTFDGSMMRLYIDGVATDSLKLEGRLADFGRPTLLGRYEHFPAYSLPGIMDEARVSNTARSPHAIKLSFESQRAGSRLIRFESD